MIVSKMLKLFVIVLVFGISILVIPQEATASSTTLRVVSMTGASSITLSPGQTVHFKIEAVGPVNLKGFSLVVCSEGPGRSSDAVVEPIWEYVNQTMFSGGGSYGRNASDIGVCVNIGIDGDGSTINGGTYELGQAQYSHISGSITRFKVKAAKMIQGQGVIQPYSDIVFQDLLVRWLCQWPC